MSGNILRIPNNATSSTPLGATLKRFHTGDARVIEYVTRWKDQALLSRLRSLDGQWNKTVVKLLGGLYTWYSVHNIDVTRPFDSMKIFLDPNDENYWEDTFDRPMLIDEGIFSLYLSGSELKDSYNVLLSQTARIKNFSPPGTFTELSDTPLDYTGNAGKYIGVGIDGTSVSFLYPKTQATLLSLTDGPGSYPALESVITSDISDLSTKDLYDSRSWRMTPLVYTGLVDLFSFSGTQCDNVLYSLDLGVMASNTAFHITLGTTFDGARICIKATSGENLNNNKYIHADTGAGVTLMSASPPDRYQVQPPFALTFVYSTATQSYYLTEKFEAF
jgi:hypothetical protein